MTVEQLRKAHQARPFTPFTLRAGGGRDHHVPHPEFMFIPPQGRTVFVVDEDGAGEVIDLMLVESLHFNDGRSNGRRHRGSG